MTNEAYRRAAARALTQLALAHYTREPNNRAFLNSKARNPVNNVANKVTTVKPHALATNNEKLHGMPLANLRAQAAAWKLSTKGDAYALRNRLRKYALKMHQATRHRAVAGAFTYAMLYARIDQLVRAAMYEFGYLWRETPARVYEYAASQGIAVNSNMDGALRAISFPVVARTVFEDIFRVNRVVSAGKPDTYSITWKNSRTLTQTPLANAQPRVIRAVQAAVRAFNLEANRAARHARQTKARQTKRNRSPNGPSKNNARAQKRR